MPTPFYHLRFVQEMLANHDLPPLIHAHLPEFFFGNIAPDAQTLSGQRRVETHFFDHTTGDEVAWLKVLAAHPALAHPKRLSPPHAAFLAGYFAHLTLDQIWIGDLFDPIFGAKAEWEDFPERIFVHNVLRIYLDRIDLPQLGTQLGADLLRVKPDNWLPFLKDDDLGAWRDFVARQVTSEADSQTVEVFAKRLRRAPEDFESLLQSPSAMQAQVFSRVSFAFLADIRARGMAHCLQTIHTYLDN